MKRTKYWVVWNSDIKKWKVTKTGQFRALKIFDIKSKAIDYGVKVARNNESSQLFIKNKDGKIAEERTYGNDPCPPKG